MDLLLHRKAGGSASEDRAIEIGVRARLVSSHRVLDVSAFEQCVASGKYQAAVQKDMEEGTRAGATGTPSFFINGRLLLGAQPLESFAQVIEDELARAQ